VFEFKLLEVVVAELETFCGQIQGFEVVLVELESGCGRIRAFF
jgi:hypothetical protein